MSAVLRLERLVLAVLPIGAAPQLHDPRCPWNGEQQCACDPREQNRDPQRQVTAKAKEADLHPLPAAVTVALDLAESLDPRERSAGRRVLDRLLRAL